MLKALKAINLSRSNRGSLKDQLVNVHFALSITILAFTIFQEFNGSLLTPYEISPFFSSLFFKLTCLSAAVNFVQWGLQKNLKNIALSVILVGVAYQVYVATYDMRFLSYTLLCIAIANLNFKACLTTFVCLMVFLLTSAVLANLLEINTRVFVGFRNDGFRYSFGFFHPNIFGAYIFCTAITLWTMFKDKISHLVFIVVFSILWLFLYKFVDCRTAQICFVVAIVLLVFAYVYDCLPKELLKIFKRYAFIALIVSILVVAIVAVVLSLSYDPQNEYWYKLNKWFSSRLALNHNALLKHGISLFGNKVNETDWDPSGFDATVSTLYEAIDCYYVYVLVRWGILSLICLTITNMLVAVRELQIGKYRGAISLFVLSLYGVMESTLFSVCYNIFIYLIFINSTKAKAVYSLKTLFLKICSLVQFIFQSSYSLLYKVLADVYFVILGNFISFNQTDNGQEKLYRRAYLKVFGALLSCIVLLVIIFFTNIFDYFKTISNIFNLSEIYSKNLLIAIFVCVFLVAFLFVKSLGNYVLHKSFGANEAISLKKANWYVLFCSAFVLILSVVISEVSLRKEIEHRHDDIKQVQIIADTLKANDNSFDIFVDKVPTLYKRAGIDVTSRNVFFDSVSLDNNPSLVFADPNDEHIVLFNKGYKFAKLSPTLSLYVRDNNLINKIEKLQIKFSDKYTCHKRLNLKRLAYINHVKYRKQNLYLQNKEHPLLKVDPLYLTSGKYRFSFAYHYDVEKAVSDDNTLFKFVITSNNGAIKILEGNVEIEKKEGVHTATYEFAISENKHSVNIQIFSNIMSNLYFSEIGYEKFE